MTKQPCEACEGYGFLLGNPQSTGDLEIQRCDACREIDDSVMTKLVFNLAREALDAADMLRHWCGPDSDYDPLMNAAQANITAIA